MMSQERDTHFLKSAERVAALIGDTRPADLPTLLARYAYDLVKNAIQEADTASALESAHADFDTYIAFIPDLTQWPDSYTNE